MKRISLIFAVLCGLSSFAYADYILEAGKGTYFEVDSSSLIIKADIPHISTGTTGSLPPSRLDTGDNQTVKVGSATISDTATNALNLGGVAAASYSQTSHNHTGTYQTADDDLTDLADGSLTGSKVGSGIPAANIAVGTNEGVRVGTATIADTATNATKLNSQEASYYATKAGLDAVGVATATLRTDLTTETNNRVSGDFTVGATTATLKTDITTETNNRVSGDFTVGATTATLKSDITTETNARIAADFAIGLTTATEASTRASADTEIKNSTYTVASISLSPSQISAGSLDSDVISSSMAVNSVYKEALKDVNLDSTIPVMGSTTTISTNAVRISPFFDSAITISTITVSVIGGTSVTGMIEQRTKAGKGSAGTDIWSGDITADTTFIGGTVSDFTVPLGSALFFVPTSWSGAVNNVEITGSATRD